MVIAWLALCTACATLVLPAPAAATLPGANGRIAFGVLEQQYGGSDEEEWFITGFRLGLMTEDGRHRRLITDDLEPSFSPDGRLLAVAESSPWGIVLYRLNGHPFRRLTYSDDRHPTWSPSGRRIAYSRERCERTDDEGRCFDRIYTISSNGRDRRLLAEDATDPDWSSRNKIAYTSSAVPRDPVLSLPIPPGGSFNSDSTVVVSDLNGERVRMVAAGHSPSWSPSGDRIAFVPPGQRAIATVGANGGPVRTVFRSKDGVSSPVWSPDGRRLAFITKWGVTSVSMSGGSRARMLPRDWCPFCDADSNSVEALAWQPLPRR